MKKILYSFLSIFSLIGIGGNFSPADIQQQAKIQSISLSTPFYLETSSSMQQQGGQTLLADHVLLSEFVFTKSVNDIRSHDLVLN